MLRGAVAGFESSARRSRPIRLRVAAGRPLRYGVRWAAIESPICTRPSGKYSSHRRETNAAVASSQATSAGYQGFILASMTIGGS